MQVEYVTRVDLIVKLSESCYLTLLTVCNLSAEL